MNDDLKPVLQAIDSADAVILGSPIYFGDITAESRAFFERFMFQVLNYEGPAFMDSKKKIGCIYTINAPESYVADIAGKYEMLFGLFHQHAGYVAATETLQSDKYDRFYVGDAANEAYKKQLSGLMSIFWTQKVKLFYATLLANNSH